MIAANCEWKIQNSFHHAKFKHIAKLNCLFNGQFQYDVKNDVLPTKCDSKQTIVMFVF